MKRFLAIANGAFAALALLAPAAVLAAPNTHGSITGAGAGGIITPNHTGPGDNNRGDTWLQTVGPCADHNAEVLNHNADAMSGCNLAIPGGNPEFEPPAEPTAENLQYSEIGTVEDVNPDHNPHLPCANIEVMGKDMADANGFYSIDYWPPTGNKGGVYGKNSDGTSALSLPAMINGDSDVSNNGSWKYSATPTTISKQGKVGGYQVMDIIDVSALVHNAQLIQPDPQDIQGYHFKLQFSQDPQKHKTFWVKCAGPSTPPPPPPPGASTGSVAGIVYLCDNGAQTGTQAPGNVTIGSVSGASPQTATGLTSGSSQAVTATAGSGYELVNCGAPQAVSAGCTISGMNGTGTVTVPANSTATVCFYEQQTAGGGEGAGTPPGGVVPAAVPGAGDGTGGNGLGAGSPPAGGVLGASTTKAPVSAVLGTGATMPLTGSQAALRLCLALALVAAGLFVVRTTARTRTE